VAAVYQYIGSYVKYLHVGAHYLVPVVWWYLQAFICGGRFPYIRCLSVISSVLASGLFICVKIHCMSPCPVYCVARHSKHHRCLPSL